MYSVVVTSANFKYLFLFLAVAGIRGSLSSFTYERRQQNLVIQVRMKPKNMNVACEHSRMVRTQEWAVT